MPQGKADMKMLYHMIQSSLRKKSNERQDENGKN